jgi:uncharacterized membrane protein
MARIVKRVQVEAPVEEVFELISDLERMPEWMKTCKSHMVTSEQKRGVGTQTHCVMETAGRTIEYNSVVTE